MIRNFASSLYLGMKHSSGELRDWDTLSTGAPAAFFEPPAAVTLGKCVARLQGLADGIVAPSTLHLFWDWFGGLDPRKDVVFADAQLYRVGTWGVERAIGKGVSAAKFRHQCATSLRRLVRQNSGLRRRPVVVTDGWCPFCGKPAPLLDYLRIIEPFNGLLVVDDTQALGIFGKKPDLLMPYGYGGGGLLRHLNLQSERILTISSLAKAFGAPLATMCGSASEIQKFSMRSETRVNTSPPSAAALAAGKNALKLNAASGPGLREKLFQNVLFFKDCMLENGFETKGGFFPVQTISGLDGKVARRVHAALWEKGIRTVPVLAHDKSPKLCWLLNAQQTERTIERACQVFFSITKRQAVPLLKRYNYENPARRNFIA
jgi:8-amino-7-oxononanoate synthase